MPTYIYETLTKCCQDEIKYYEIEQLEQEAPLTSHPETGEAIKRVEIDGEELIKKDRPEGSCGCGSGGCC
jgi:hypothetical protein